MEQGAAEKDGDGTQTILRYEFLTEVLTERKNFLISYTAKYLVHLDRIKNSSEAGVNSRCWFGDLVETEACFSVHGAVCRHSNLGGGAGG